MLVAQKLIRNTQGKLFAVREVLILTPQLRQYLKPLTKSPDDLYRKIDAIMASGALGAQSYEAQGRRMLEEGVIDKDNYRRLVEDGQSFDGPTLELLDSL